MKCITTLTRQSTLTQFGEIPFYHTAMPGEQCKLFKVNSQCLPGIVCIQLYSSRVSLFMAGAEKKAEVFMRLETTLHERHSGQATR